MKSSRHSETVVVEDSRQRDKSAALLESLRHDAVALEVSIQDEELRTGMHDPSHYAYPVAARMMVERRDNLKATIATLEQRLA